MRSPMAARISTTEVNIANLLDGPKSLRRKASMPPAMMSVVLIIAAPDFENASLTIP